MHDRRRFLVVDSDWVQKSSERAWALLLQLTTRAILVTRPALK